MKFQSNKQRGYSLIEVLLATSIFSLVLIVGVSSFATVNRVAREARVYQEISQTGVFISETLAGAIRNSSGIRSGSSGPFSANPFEISNQNLSVCDPVGNYSQSGTVLETRAEGERHRSFLASEGDFIVRDLGLFSNEEGSLLLDGIELVGDVCFWGADYNQDALNVQPYVYFEYTLRHTNSNVSKTFRSAVAGREYF